MSTYVLANAPIRIYTAQPCARVIAMDTDHSPFFSAPDHLVHHLVALAG